MALEPMTQMLQKAQKGRYAVGQFNINNLEYTQAILAAAQEEGSPVILGVSTGAKRYMGGYKVVSAIVRAIIEESAVTVPVALHLDHGPTFEDCILSLDAGFSSVMFDGSHYPLEENIALTKKVTEIAHIVGASVEAELGRIGGQEDDVKVHDADANYAIPEECVRLVKETGIDALAPALGSAHGLYKGEPKLAFDRMEVIRDMTGMPLVLHGGSGIPPADIKKAISLGTCKVNVNTENQIVGTAKIREVLKDNPDMYDPRKYMGPGRDAIKKMVIYKIREFGSNGKA
jgi:fructose-bisphosphate aldolase class II